ncbi:MAG: glycosyltransferase family 4 protein [Rhizobiales bacterium]|nr:glycosyltransferase family 4 protein [Hyphomicrobiales bacterium]
MRAPVGGLFRHVVDLASGQAARGHRVGVIADASTGAKLAEATLSSMAQTMALGVRRIAMSRHIGWGDASAVRLVSSVASEENVDVIHGHGAKGGAYARLARSRRAIRAYTPHGGSLHYSRASPIGFMYLTMERILIPRTDLFLFESAYGQKVFQAQVGEPGAKARIIHNGVAAEEFVPLASGAEATDLVFVGELRLLKGVDVLLDAIALLHREGMPVSATIVGDGPDAGLFRAQAERLALAAVRFPGAMPARAAFANGRVLVVPSRAESLPYVVLEAAAAAMPLIATAVGGIPEIISAPEALVPAGDSGALAHAIRATLTDLSAASVRAAHLQEDIRRRFSADVMTDQVITAYQQALRAH